MPEVRQASVGAGVASAATGLALVLFLVAHLGGVALALPAPGAFERYAEHLHGRPWLPPAEAVLAAAALAHLGLALHRTVRFRRARGPAAAALGSRRAAAGAMEALAALAGRLAPWSGALLLAFLAVHLGQLRLHRPAAGEELAALLGVLRRPWALLLYCLAGPAVALHLLQGIEGAHRSLGLLDAGNGARIRRAGRLLAALLGGGFALVPLALAWAAPPAGGLP